VILSKKGWALIDASLWWEAASEGARGDGLCDGRCGGRIPEGSRITKEVYRYHREGALLFSLERFKSEFCRSDGPGKEEKEGSGRKKKKTKTQKKEKKKKRIHRKTDIEMKRT